jgi:hypothetical protein
METNTHATKEEPWEAVFSIWSVLRLYKVGQMSFLRLMFLRAADISNLEFLQSNFPPIQGICSGPRLLIHFRNKLIFYGEELLAPHPTPKLEDHPLSAVHDSLFNIFAATHIHIYGGHFLHPQPEDVPCCGDIMLATIQCKTFFVFSSAV